MESSLRGPWRVGSAKRRRSIVVKARNGIEMENFAKEESNFNHFSKKKKGAEGGTGKFSLWRALAKKFHFSKLPNSIFQFESKEQFSFVRFYSI